jgi:hypothetical protein
MEDEVTSLPHIMMTSDFDWDPSIYDEDIIDLSDFHDPSQHLKMILESTTLVGIESITFILLLLIAPASKKNFMMHFSTLKIKWMI